MMKNYFKPSGKLLDIILDEILDNFPSEEHPVFKKEYKESVEEDMRMGLATLCYPDDNLKKPEVKILNENKEFEEHLEEFFGLRLEIYGSDGFYPYKDPETKERIFSQLACDLYDWADKKIPDPAGWNYEIRNDGLYLNFSEKDQRIRKEWDNERKKFEEKNDGPWEVARSATEELS